MLVDTSEANLPRRWIAVLLSIAFAGMGHAYVGKTRRALALWMLVWVCAAIAIVGVVVTRSPWMFAFLLPMILSNVVFAIDVAQIAHATYRSRRWYRIGLDTLAILALPVGLALAIRVFLVEAFKIPAASMSPTLLVGDHLFVNKAAYRFRAPEPGEVAVFQFPEKPEQDFVKRVVAVGGDRVNVSSERLIINGWEVPRCLVGKAVMSESDPSHPGRTGEEGKLFVEFLHGRAYLVFFDPSVSDDQGPYVVRDGEYFVLGDNRNQSYDSRLWFEGAGGGVPRALMKGPATVIWMSFDHVGAPAFDRIGTRLDHEIALPATMSSLRPALEKCLAEAPVASATFPPPATR